MKKTILVIGSNSFCGSSFIDYALNQNNKVIGVSRSNQPNNIFLKYTTNRNIENYYFYRIDLNKKNDLLIK